MSSPFTYTHISVIPAQFPLNDSTDTDKETENLFPFTLAYRQRLTSEKQIHARDPTRIRKLYDAGFILKALLSQISAFALIHGNKETVILTEVFLPVPSLSTP